MMHYDTFISRIAPQVQPCPHFMMRDALQLVSADFFTRSEIWRETCVASLFKGDRFATLPMERGTAFVRIVELLLDGSRMEGGKQFTVDQAGEGATIEFAFEPDQDRTAYVTAVVRPSRMATEIPMRFADEWGDVLVYGALAKLKCMGGKHIGWTDPQGAALNLQLYEDDLARAKVQIARGRDGRRLFMRTGR